VNIRRDLTNLASQRPYTACHRFSFDGLFFFINVHILISRLHPTLQQQNVLKTLRMKTTLLQKFVAAAQPITKIAPGVHLRRV
jgi:hypothetical protein